MLFTCEMCKGIFEDDTPEEEKVSEMVRLFGVTENEPKSSVCHDCWLAMGCDQIGAHQA